MSQALEKWLEKATSQQRKQLAKSSKISLSYLCHLASGRRTASAEMALRIVEAASRPDLAGLPPLKQELLCPACRGCSYAKSAQRG